MKLPLTGGCQCRAVRYKISAEPLTLYACHCTECQKQSSSAFGMSLSVPWDGFDITSGTPKKWQRPADSGNYVDCYSCEDCGVRIYHAAAGRKDWLNVKPGTLDHTRWLRPVGHLWTDSAGAGPPCRRAGRDRPAYLRRRRPSPARCRSIDVRRV